MRQAITHSNRFSSNKYFMYYIKKIENVKRLEKIENVKKRN